MHPYQKLKSEIEAHYSDRAIAIVAVSKFRTLEEIQAALDAGATMIAENRVQEAQKKFPHLDLDGVETHLIGHLQRNKVKDALALFDVIQSVDSLRLAEAINTEAEKLDKKARIYIQVNTANDPDKFGFSVNEFWQAIEHISQLPHLSIEGLMTIGKLDADKKQTAHAFSLLQDLFENVRQKDIFDTQSPMLSMGMSNDYEIALENGSTMIRVGSRIFNVYNGKK